MSSVDMVLVHGGGQGGWVWDETIAALRVQAPDRLGRLVALDGPGCGAKRERDVASMTMEAVIDDLVADIDAADLARPMLVGHSHAGSILPLIAERRPELFSRLVYVSTIAPLPGQSNAQLMGRGKQGDCPDEVGFPEPLTGSNSRHLFPRMFCNDMDAGATAAFLARLGGDMWPHATMDFTGFRYDHLHAVPTTYIHCLRDGILPLEWQARFAERLRADRTVRIDAGHQVMNSRPHGLAEILLNEAV